MHAQLAAGSLYQSLALALGAGIAATLFAVLSLTVQLSRARVARNVLLFLSRFLGRVGLLVLTTFWIFALAVLGFGALFNQVGLSRREPFHPGVAAFISLAGAIVYLAIRGLRAIRRRARMRA